MYVLPRPAFEEVRPHTMLPRFESTLRLARSRAKHRRVKWTPFVGQFSAKFYLDAWQSPTDWHRVVLFGKVAEYARIIEKGSLVMAQSPVGTREYEHIKDGVRHRVFELRAEIPATSQWVSSGRRFPMAIMLVLAGGESRSEARGSTLHSVKEASGKAAAG